MDTQIWYAIFSTIFGGIHGAFSHLGEVRNYYFVFFIKYKFQQSCCPLQCLCSLLNIFSIRFCVKIRNLYLITVFLQLDDLP